jgi:hypothetical protein
VALGSLLGTASVIVALATFAGLALQRGIVTGLRERLKDADDENGRLERRLEDAEKGLIQAQRDLEALQRIVTKEVQMTALGDQMQHMNTLLIEIRDSLGRRSA